MQVLLALTINDSMKRREDGVWTMSCLVTKTGAQLLEYEVIHNLAAC